MPSATKKLKFSIPTDLQFEVGLAPFRLSGNLKYLDFSKFRSRRCRLELGEYDGSCCATKLYAVVESGKVVRVELEKRKDAKTPPPFIKQALAKAVETFSRGAAPNFEPMPVEEFVQTLKRDSSPSGPSRSTMCFSLDVMIPWVGKRSLVCCVTWHRASNGKLVIDEIGCGDWLSFQY